MFTRLAEEYVRPTLLCEGQIHPGRRNVDELLAVIEGEIVVGLAFKLGQYFRVVAIDPARGRNVDGLELTFDFVLVAEPVRDDVEL